MSDVTTGPIQTYSGDTTLATTTTLDSDQERVSVTLTDSNLWLVDPTKLNGQTVDSQEQYTLLNLETSNQTTTSFDNVNFTASTVNSTGLTSDSTYLQSSLPEGDALMLASVTGGSQLSSDGVSLTSTGSSGSSDSTSSGGTSGSLTGSGGGSGGSGATAPSGSSSTDSSTDGQSTDGQTTLSTTTTASDPQPPGSPQPGASPSPTGTPQLPQPVPFEISPTIGLLLLLVIFGHRLLLKRTPRAARVSSVTD